ncbi:DHS-like NAD/FAD-binding domain-containing protein [Paraphysoderma sedebokerense]|nr:DHS-like NAD/FAD-binding domain-containing protein [Paraphysoderma sedebokerense]
MMSNIHCPSDVILRENGASLNHSTVSPKLINPTQLHNGNNKYESHDDSMVENQEVEGVADTMQTEGAEQVEVEDDESMLNMEDDPEDYVITTEERNSLRAEAKRLGLADFISKYLLVDRFPVKRLIRIFFDHFTEYEREQIDLSIKEQAILYAYAQIPVGRHIRTRERLSHINNFDHVIDLIQKSNRIMVITGAGISVSCGIPDFRSKNGIYARLDEYNLDDPQQMFDLKYFKICPETFYSFAREIYPSNFKPSPSHLFVKAIEERGKLLRNYTQNIDNIESLAGVGRVMQCHGSFATARCVRCKYSVPGDALKDDIFAKRVPRCPVCPDSDDEGESKSIDAPAVMKPDIVFFGENLPETYYNLIDVDRHSADLVIVMGSSLKVAPVSEIIRQVPEHVPQVIINRELLPHLKSHFDVQLLGPCDTIVSLISKRLGWDILHEHLPNGSNQHLEADYTFVEPNICLFEGGLLQPEVVSESEDEDWRESDEEDEDFKHEGDQRDRDSGDDEDDEDESDEDGPLDEDEVHNLLAETAARDNPAKRPRTDEYLEKGNIGEDNEDMEDDGDRDVKRFKQ